MNKFLFIICLLLLFFAEAYSQRSGFYDVKDFGARGDSSTLDTKSIQAAIDRCNSEGGGTVLLAQGRFRTGTLYLKSYVTLRIEAGTVLLGSTNVADYTTDTHKMMYKNEPLMNRCLIFARDAVSIAIEGLGEINGHGSPKNFPTERPLLIRLLNCKNVHLKDISLKDPASWTSAWLYCSDIFVDNIRISSLANFNGDGLDFDGCQNVLVSNCSFDTSDDAICLQTSKPDKPCRNVVINNCIFHSKWAGIRIGLLSRGDIESVTVNNCVFTDIDDSGLKIQMNEGAVMKNMVFSNLVMKNVLRPIFMTHCQQRACVDAPQELAPMKSMNGFLFENILVESGDTGKSSVIIISGMPGHPIENITLKNIRMTSGGGGNHGDASIRTINEFTPGVLNGWWPEVSLLGTIPAYGLYARHITDLAISDVIFSTEKDDVRPSLVLEDVKYARLAGIQSIGMGTSESELRFHNVQEVTVRDCSAKGTAKVLVKVEGEKSNRILISVSNFFQRKDIYIRSTEVRKDAVKILK
jgi:polygalacturonase